MQHFRIPESGICLRAVCSIFYLIKLPGSIFFTRQISGAFEFSEYLLRFLLRALHPCEHELEHTAAFAKCSSTAYR